MSTTVLPLLRPSAMPPLLKSTFSTSGVSGTIVKMISACRATSAALAQATAPASVSAAGTLLRV